MGAKYEVRYVGKLPQCKGFNRGEWITVSENVAKTYSEKLSFEVRDEKGVLKREDFLKMDSRSAVKRNNEIARTLRQAEKESRATLKARGEYTGEVPHDDGWVPKEVDVPGLPPVGLEIQKDVPRQVLKNLRSQQDVSPAVLSEYRLGKSETVNLQFDPNRAISQQVAQLGSALKNTRLSDILARR